MLVDSSREPFGFSMSVLVPTGRSTTLKQLVVTALQCILTPLFVIFDIFDLVVLYLIYVCFVHNNDPSLGQNISAMVPSVCVSLY